MEYLSGEKKIVFVGLNPVKEANEAHAVFCIRNTFWKILEKARIIEGYPYNLIECANEIFNTDKFTSHKLGYADLVPECDFKKSSKVRILPHHVKDLLQKIKSSNADKIVFLGHKVAAAFVKELKIKESWDSFKRMEYNYISVKGKNRVCINYGFFAKYEYSDKEFELYVMPFPETSPIPNKHIFYRRIIE